MNRPDGSRPTLFLLHGLGLSARFWDRLIPELGSSFACVALDLPGFGDARDATTLTTEAMADWLVEAIRARAPEAWMLVGHSMGGKLATLVAARVAAGEPGLAGLVGVVLLAGSPPSPEPIDEDRRAKMCGWFADGIPDETVARDFVAANIVGALPEDAMRQAISDVRRSSREAWLGWLERGSREDWSAAVGVLPTPALIVAGAQDADLGEANQRRLNLPHYADGEIEIVADAAHFLPLEQPGAVAALIAGHWRRVAERRALPLATERLIRSDRTSARTRRVLLDRLTPPAETDVLTPAQRATLVAMIARILPGCGDPADLALRIEAELAVNIGDGWRFAALPADGDAWRLGLDTLAVVAAGFAELPPAQQDVSLQRLADGEGGIDGMPGRLSGAQMTLWFEDVCAVAVRIWLSHPAALAQIGYDGFATGGDGIRKQGYQRLGAGEREAWQPTLASGAGR